MSADDVLIGASSKTTTQYRRIDEDTVQCVGCEAGNFYPCAHAYRNDVKFYCTGCGKELFAHI